MDYKARYEALCHAMQTGVAYSIEKQLDAGTDPKHLRVGVNSALVSNAALAKLLMEKGIITEEEYFMSLCELMEAEVKMYEQELSVAYGTKITLG